jgi:hypothetical protein
MMMMTMTMATAMLMMKKVIRELWSRWSKVYSCCTSSFLFKVLVSKNKCQSLNALESYGKQTEQTKWFVIVRQDWQLGLISEYFSHLWCFYSGYILVVFLVVLCMMFFQYTCVWSNIPLIIHKALLSLLFLCIHTYDVIYMCFVSQVFPGALFEVQFFCDMKGKREGRSLFIKSE